MIDAMKCFDKINDKELKNRELFCEFIEIQIIQNQLLVNQTAYMKFLNKAKSTIDVLVEQALEGKDEEKEIE